MARGDYTPEIKKSLGTGKPGRVNMSPPKKSPAQVAKQPMGGIDKGEPRDALAQQQPRETPQIPTGPKNPQPPQHNKVPQPPEHPDMHHVAAATSIAHAILNRRSGGM
jgi:hypothetical protein